MLILEKSNAPFFIQHETVTVPDISNPDFGGEDAVKDFLIGFQGAYVCLSSDSHTASVLQLFSKIHSVTDDLVIESHAGDVYLTPVRSRDSVIRDSDIVVDFSTPNFGRDVFSEPKASSYSIDLKEKFPAQEDFQPDAVRRFFDLVLAQAKPTKHVTLSGNLPLVPVFLSVALFREVADGLKYEGVSPEPIQVF